MIRVGFKHRGLKIILDLDNKITVIIGNSATGKSTTHRILTDGDITSHTEVQGGNYSIVYLSKSNVDEYLNSEHVFKSWHVYLMDEHRIEIDDKIALAIRDSNNSYFVISTRSNLGVLNFDINNVKKLETDSSGTVHLVDLTNVLK